MTMKKCTQCGLEKPLSEFHKAGLTATGKQRYRSSCKTCANKKEAERYYAKKTFLDAQKHQCAKCGDTRIYVLDFHHINSDDKDFTIGKLKKKDCSILQQEIDKCVVLCANCHREFHYLEKQNNITLDDYLNNGASPNGREHGSDPWSEGSIPSAPAT